MSRIVRDEDAEGHHQATLALTASAG